MDNTEWYSKVNKILKRLFQRFRSYGFICLLNVPSFNLFDSRVRKLIHANWQTQHIDYDNEKTVIKPILWQYNEELDKIYHKYMRVRKAGRYRKLKRWAVPKPSDKLIQVYEEKKQRFNEMQDKIAMGELNLLKNGGEKKKVKCEYCGYRWFPRGSGTVRKCPSCQKKILLEKDEEYGRQGP